ncbi:MAG: DUF1501 domain-containing protein, partial [Planctomycetia bacterium]
MKRNTDRRIPFPYPTSPSTRREMLRRGGMGFGSLALAGLLGEARAGDGSRPSGEEKSSANPLAPRLPHFRPTAKRMIHIFMNGGPSHVDTFDPKPTLTRLAGKPVATSAFKTERPTGAALASPFSFQRYGRGGLEISELFRHVAESADDLCVIRSMHADVPNHEPSLMLMNCGEARQPRPSMGSWLLYGLGTENQNLPGFIVLCPNGMPISETQNWRSAFLPGVYQGSYVDTQHTDIEKLIQNIRNDYVGTSEQRGQLDLLLELNRRHQARRDQDQQLDSRIQSFELAFRMQSEAADAFDVAREPEYIRKMYGDGVHARQLLIARRLLERGVRYIQVWHGEGQPWDNHDDIEVNHRRLAKQCDQPIGALLKDLKARGMLDDTLVVWGGEFGRTPTVELPTPGANQGKLNGRDHNHYGFTMWLAGGGVKGGLAYG